MKGSVNPGVNGNDINALIKKAQQNEKLTLELTEMKQLVSKYQDHEYSETSQRPLDSNKKKLPKTSDKSINGYRIS
jgi:two-component SAPR family response regulator